MNRVNTVSGSKGNSVNLFNSSESGFRNGTMVNIKHASKFGFLVLKICIFFSMIEQLIKNFNTENQGN